jgi:PAS domain S-box-containing protein
MGDPPERARERKERLKALIKRLHAGERPEDLKEEFKEIVGDASSAEIPQMEEELIREGMPREEIHRLCDVHLAVFKETLERGAAPAPAGHPITTLTEEHRLLLGFAEELKCAAEAVRTARDPASSGSETEKVIGIAARIRESTTHYLREENVLFPYLEKHGITQPPAIMWSEHDRIREIEAGLFECIEARDSTPFAEFARGLERQAVSLAEMLQSHFYKENNILFPTALRVISRAEWGEIGEGFDELGYCPFTPEAARGAAGRSRPAPPREEEEGVMRFETGEFSQEELEAILDSLPVDLTFVDRDDSVRYFSQSKERIFPRTKAIIGRKVQQCHPQKSLHVVNQIVEDFKNGKREVAEFWINMDGRLVYIRYFPVRSKEGEYLGVIEVTQDITEVKKIEGEKRLL